MEWEIKDGKLSKQFECQDFEQAVSRLKQIAQIAEHINHHPDLKIHAYKKLLVEVYTHESQKITEKDYDLSKRIDQLF
tara:strand:- start:711 stop:944 length:234 start_codon:yes stop_codon:yes gene_type:complete